ncbi:hypothetical protein TKK_0000767 [Trichogramma kaykai]
MRIDDRNQIEPGRKKRSVTYTYQNWTRDPQGESIRVGQRFRVVSSDDLPHRDSGPVQQVPYDDASSDYEDHQQQISSQLPATTSGIGGGNVCLSYLGFYSASATILVALAVSSLSAVLLYSKLQRLKYEKTLDMPRCS